MYTQINGELKRKTELMQVFQKSKTKHVSITLEAFFITILKFLWLIEITIAQTN